MLLTVRAVSILVGRRPATVRRWIENGELRAYHVGNSGRMAVRPRDLAALLGMSLDELLDELPDADAEGLEEAVEEE